MEDIWIAGMFPINMWNVYQATGPHTNNRDHILTTTWKVGTKLPQTDYLSGLSYLVYASVTDSCKRFGHVAIQKIKRCGFVGKVTQNVNLDTGQECYARVLYLWLVSGVEFELLNHDVFSQSTEVRGEEGNDMVTLASSVISAA